MITYIFNSYCIHKLIITSYLAYIKSNSISVNPNVAYFADVMIFFGPICIFCYLNFKKFNITKFNWSEHNIFTIDFKNIYAKIQNINIMCQI